MKQFALAPNELARLVALCGMFGSEHAGERAVAALKAHEFVKERGLGWAEVLHATPAPVVVVPADRSWRDTADDLLNDHNGALTDWEARFLADVLSKGRAPTVRQGEVLRRLAQKCGVPIW